MTHAEAHMIAQQKAENLKNGQLIRITPDADFNYWVMRYRNGEVYIGYFITEKMPPFYSNRKEYAEVNQRTNEVFAYWQKANFNIKF